MQASPNIAVADLASSERFDVAAFGLRPARRLGVDTLELLGAPLPIYLLQKAAGTRAAAQADAVRDYARHWTPVHIDVVVDDVDAAVRRVCAVRATLESPPHATAWGTMVADPFGHGWCLLRFNARGYDAVADPA